MPTLSVIITVYKHDNVTVAHVRECMNSSIIPDEIIVVNDGGNESLKDDLKKLTLNTKVIYAYITEDIPWNYTGARNLGVWLSTGDFLSMEDNDNIPSKEAYKKAFAYYEEHPEVGRVVYGRRAKVSKDEVHKPVEEWKTHGRSARHQDTTMLRRDTLLGIKGNDERFATRYAWACSDLKRRMARNGIKSGDVSEFFYTVYDANTKCCECGEEKRVFDGAKSFCIICNLPIWRKSYTNYNMARESDSWGKKNREHIQSPLGILNFNYEFEIL